MVVFRLFSWLILTMNTFSTEVSSGMNKDKDFISLFFIPLGTGTNVSISPK